MTHTMRVPPIERAFLASSFMSFISSSSFPESGQHLIQFFTKSIDGFRPYLGIVDEYHAHKDNQMYKLLKGGTRKLKESLVSIITTAGFNLNSPCYELYRYCRRVLRKVDKNETQFIYIAP